MFLFWKIEHQPSSKNFSQHRKIFVSRKLKKQYQVKSQKNKYKWMKLKKIKIKGLKLKKKGHELSIDHANQSLNLAKLKGAEHFFDLQIQFLKL